MQTDYQHLNHFHTEAEGILLHRKTNRYITFLMESFGTNVALVGLLKVVRLAVRDQSRHTVERLVAKLTQNKLVEKTTNEIGILQP